MVSGKTLRDAMTYPGYPAPLSLASYTALAPATNVALHQARCGTPQRVSMLFAQVGAESGSLRWREELASGADYEWRSDLGNNRAGDGRKFKGHGFIQVTGRHNHQKLSEWAFKHGYVPTRTYFVDNPRKLVTDKYVWLGVVWYWTVARNMNSYADRRDIVGATQAVNGGQNNISGRRKRWQKCLSLGKAMSYGAPAKPAAPKPKPKPKPTPKPKPKPVPKPPVKKPNPVTKRISVKVRSGDSLGKIAARYHTSWQQLVKLNAKAYPSLKNHPEFIKIGWKLRVK